MNAELGMNRARRIFVVKFSAALLIAGLGTSALAQYKVVGPDGRVTYTDRPPVAASGAQVTALRRHGGAAVAGAELPLELRQTAARFPVALYTSAECAPCDTGRRLLQARGVPYAEYGVSDNPDLAALERLSDGRTVPTLTVGKQVLRGFSATEWQSTLDLATYPRESGLPAGYSQPSPTPLTQRKPAALGPAGAPDQPPAPRAAAAEQRPAPVPGPTAASGPSIRF